MRKHFLSLSLIGALILIAAAPVLTNHAAAQEKTSLKMGLLPILDVLPFYVAADAGYFEAAGLDVELIPVSSALERDQLMIAGEIDGMLTDLQSVGIFNQDQVRIQLVALARRAYPDAPQFRILATPNSGLSTPEDLKGVEIGISENSVIHYLTQRILESEGLSVDDLAFRPEPNIPVRFQLLMEGALKAATLPDPLAQAAIEAGAILIADDTALVEQQFSQSVLAFSTDVIENHPDAVQTFLEAWMQAADDINTTPDAYRELWLENTAVPDSVKDSYVLPPFPTYEITTEAAFNDTIMWLKDLDIVDAEADYATSVNPTFIEAITPAASAAGDAANGEALFASSGCVGCHSLDGTPGAGPSLQGVASRAGETVEGMDAVAYLTESLVNPSAYVVEGFNPIMPGYDALSTSDQADLVAYLLTLE